MHQTITDIENNPAVVLLVWDKDMNGYKLIGKAEYFKKGKWLEYVKNLSGNETDPMCNNYEELAKIVNPYEYIYSKVTGTKYSVSKIPTRTPINPTIAVSIRHLF